MNDQDEQLFNQDDVTSDDKLWALLTYIFTPLVPIIILLLEDKKNRPFIKAHNGQALILGVINLAISILFGWLVFPLCINLGLWVYCIYLGISAYQGKMVTVPVITDLAKGQGWA